MAIILIATLTNLEPNWHDGLAGQRLARALHPPIGWDDTIDAVRNIVLFAGFGAVWEVTTRLRLRTALWRATLYGFLLSATVETLQLFSPARFASILDIITNTSGTFLGAFAVAVMVASVRARRQTSKYLGVPVFVFALGLLGTIAMEAGTPVVRQGYISVASASPIDKLRATLAAAGPLSFASVGASEFVLSIPAGFLAVAALMELGMSMAIATALAVIVGGAVSFVFEASHGVSAEIIFWGAAAARAVGIGVGAVLGAVVVPRVARLDELTRVRLFIAGYAAVIMGWLWRPFIPRSLSAIAQELPIGHWIPMATFGGSGSFFDVGQIIELAFLFVPFGAMLEAWPAREHGALRWLMPGVWLSALVAFGQLFIGARVFDITNFLIMVAGVWMGWWIARRAGILARGTWLPD